MEAETKDFLELLGKKRGSEKHWKEVGYNRSEQTLSFYLNKYLSEFGAEGVFHTRLPRPRESEQSLGAEWHKPQLLIGVNGKATFVLVLPQRKKLTKRQAEIKQEIEESGLGFMVVYSDRDAIEKFRAIGAIDADLEI